jgi:peptidoglycan/LPS O-acetylase OafA/YrhL
VWSTEAYWAPGFFDDGLTPLQNPARLTLWQWLGNMSLTETWRFHLVGGPQRIFWSPMWSLCYEEQFYLVTGLALAFCRGRVFAYFAAVSCVIALATLLGPAFGIDMVAGFGGFFFDGSWLMFAAGILVYYAVVYGSARTRALSLLFLSAGAGYAAWRSPSLARLEQEDPSNGLFIACVFALALVLLRPYDRGIDGMRVLQPIKWCGTRCYSLYLVHWPVAKILSKWLTLAGALSHASTLFMIVPVCVGGSALVAWAFHRTVEQRFLNVRSVVGLGRVQRSAPELSLP